jgi:tetratricopeptide (TPR) repeat protein
VDRQGEADGAFERARELLGTLVDDYPQAPAYRNSLAALVNNQALALAAAGRHADALQLYDTALQLEHENFERYGRTPDLRAMLSKMYFNQAQSQVALGRWEEAASTALRRRDLWQQDGERLVGVAAELAEIARGWQASGEDTPSAREALENEAVTTLELARKNGMPGRLDLERDERFASLRDHKLFAELLAEVSRSTDGGGEQ